MTLRGGVREGPREGGTGSVSQVREGQVKAKRTECKALRWGVPGLLTDQLSRWGHLEKRWKWSVEAGSLGP